MAAMSRTLVCLLLTGAAAVRHIDSGEDTAVALDDGMSADSMKCYEACDCDHMDDPGISVASKCPPCLHELGMHFTRHGNGVSDARDAYCAQKTTPSTTVAVMETTVELTADCNAVCDCENFDTPALGIEAKCKPCLEKKLGEHINHHNPFYKVRDSYCAPMASTTSTTTAATESTPDCNSACDCENFDTPALGIETECKPCLEKLGKHINHHNPFYKVRDSYCAPMASTTSTTTAATESTSDCNSACDCENFDTPALGIEAECKPCLEKLGKHINHHHPFDKVRDAYCAPTTTTTTETATTTTITETESTTTVTTTTTTIATTSTSEATTTTTTTSEATTTTTTVTTTTETETSTTTTTTTTTIKTTTSTSEATTTTTSTSGARHLLIRASSLVASLMSLILFN